MNPFQPADMESFCSERGNPLYSKPHLNHTRAILLQVCPLGGAWDQPENSSSSRLLGRIPTIHLIKYRDNSNHNSKMRHLRRQLLRLPLIDAILTKLRLADFIHLHHLSMETCLRPCGSLIPQPVTIMPNQPRSSLSHHSSARPHFKYDDAWQIYVRVASRPLGS
jgi:hypothetical protein